MKMQGPKLLLLLLVTVLLTSLCTLSFTCRKRTDSPVIARVGRALLTLDDLYERIPPEYSDRITREQKINYVKQWIDTELLFQEALRQKIDHEPEIRARLAKMKKDLLSAEIISRNSFTASKHNVSEDVVRAYYEEHKDSFNRESDVVKHLEIVIGDQKTARSVRTMVTKDNFLDLAVRFSKAPVQDPRALPYVPISTLPEPIAQEVKNLRVDGTTVPIEVDGAYHIVRILDKQEAGTLCSFEEVREDIISSLSTEAQKRHMDELLSNLRLKMDYEFHFELIPGPEGMPAEEQGSG